MGVYVFFEIFFRSSFLLKVEGEMDSSLSFCLQLGLKIDIEKNSIRLGIRNLF